MGLHTDILFEGFRHLAETGRGKFLFPIRLPFIVHACPLPVLSIRAHNFSNSGKYQKPHMCITVNSIFASAFGFVHHRASCQYHVSPRLSATTGGKLGGLYFCFSMGFTPDAHEPSHPNDEEAQRCSDISVSQCVPFKRITQVGGQTDE